MALISCHYLLVIILTSFKSQFQNIELTIIVLAYNNNEHIIHMTIY